MSTPVYAYPPYTAANVNLFPAADSRTDETILPSAPFANPQDITLSAWQTVLQAERDTVSALRAASSPDARCTLTRTLVQVRLVGYLFPAFWTRREVLGERPLECLAKEVESLPAGAGSLHDLGRHYQNTFVAAFRTKAGLSLPFHRPSRTPFDTVQQLLDSEMTSRTPSNHTQARRLSLARDGYSCMVSNCIDWTAKQQVREIKTILHARNGGLLPMDTVRIFNGGMLEMEMESDGPEHRRDSGVAALAVLSRFGLDGVAELFNDRVGIHSLGNILSLCGAAHGCFGDLEMVFDPVPGTEHTYDVRFTSLGRALSLPSSGMQNRVTFKVHYQPLSAKTLLLPDRRLLALHAVCAEVAHFSGAVRIFNEFIWQEEELDVLADDGSSAELLEFKLARYA
ncbi:hypothetical protein MKEN_01421900 [Mycena kentingensis (nom. inval.)]|nr:hypothetical protein MKEN_01421900 [Mycena kentingensis (nom. inval.)]